MALYQEEPSIREKKKALWKKFLYFSIAVIAIIPFTFACHEPLIILVPLVGFWVVVLWIFCIIHSRLTQQISSSPFVNLDLPSGRRWASCNVGAKSVEGRGKSVTWDDANSSYQLPSVQDWNELMTNTSIMPWRVKGVNGFKFTSKTNGNSLFIPMEKGKVADIYYWTSVLSDGNDSDAQIIEFKTWEMGCYLLSRDAGAHIRPVMDGASVQAPQKKTPSSPRRKVQTKVVEAPVKTPAEEVTEGRTLEECKAYFREIFAKHFPQYVVEEEVPVEQVFGSVAGYFKLYKTRPKQAYQAEWGKPYTFVLSTPEGVCALIMLCEPSDHHYRKVKFLVSRMFAEKNQVAYLNFITSLWNKEDYVVKRINDALS